MNYRIDSGIENIGLGEHTYSGETGRVADAVIREWHDEDSAFTDVERLYALVRDAGVSRAMTSCAVEELVNDGWLSETSA